MCALCHETLTHIVKQAEVSTGAPTATVTRKIAEKFNEGAAAGDQVSGTALKNRVQRQAGERTDKSANRANKPTPSKPPKSKYLTEDGRATEAMVFAETAISQLERIRDN